VLKNLQAELRRTRAAQAEPVQTIRAEVPTVQERVTVTPAAAPAPQDPNHDPKYDVDPSGSFEWERVRDYVLAKVAEIHGPFPRDVRKENTIFMGFAARWEGLAMDIARHAFEQAGGEWLGAPVSVARFHETSDPVFAARIAPML
jgi:hypothetical protein